MANKNKSDRERLIDDQIEKGKEEVAQKNIELGKVIEELEERDGIVDKIVEFHPEPEKALSDGEQSLNFSEFEEMMKKLAI